MRNHCTKGQLAADIGVRQANMDEAYRLHTSTNHAGPVCRNTFQIVRVEKADLFGSDSVIRFG
jgi:hypothetical protein